MIEEELSIRILTPTDKDKIPIILDSMSISHGATYKQTPEWFEWKFWRSPFGPAVVAYAETNDREIAGVVAYGMYELTKGSTHVLAALSYETFVHPKFRHRGLFTQLSQLGMHRCKELGIQIMFNFPNSASLHGFKKQNWQNVNIIRSFIRPVHWNNCITKLNYRLRFEAFIPDQIRSFNSYDYQKFDNYLSTMTSIRTDNAWAPRRTPEYMIWRYRTYPMNRYVVISDEVGWAVVRTGWRASYVEVQILEVFPTIDKYGTRFLRRISARIKERLNPDIISITLSKAHPLFPAMVKSGFFPVPNNVNFTYNALDVDLKNERRSWVITATEFHTY